MHRRVVQPWPTRAANGPNQISEIFLRTGLRGALRGHVHAMELILLILIVLVVLALVGGIGGPTRFRRRPTSRVVDEVVYRDDRVVVEEEVVEDVPVTRSRRRVVEY